MDWNCLSSILLSSPHSSGFTRPVFFAQLPLENFSVRIFGYLFDELYGFWLLKTRHMFLTRVDDFFLCGLLAWFQGNNSLDRFSPGFICE